MSVSTVYAVLDAGSDAVKIGVTRNAKTRIRNLQTGSSQRLVWLCGLDGGRDLEAFLHHVFADRRLSGEWFDDADRKVSSFFIDLVEGGDPITAARKFMREKGEECLREAKRLDDLYEAARATS